MSPRRSKYLDQAAVAALRDVAALEAAITAYEFAVRLANNRAFAGLPAEFKPDMSLRAFLWQKRAEAQSRALMFGNLSTNKELQQQAWRVAADFIVREHSAIMGYLEVENVQPGSYLGGVRNDFRDEIRAAVREKLGVPDGELAFWETYVPEDLREADDSEDETDSDEE